MRALSRRSGLAMVAATAAVMTFALPVAAETDDAIARLLAETEARNASPAAPRGREHKIVPAERPAPEDERRLFDEIEMLERARAEAEARRAQHDPPDATDAHRSTKNEQRIADERRNAEDAEYARLEAEREAEAAKIDEALSKAREAWLKKQNDPTAQPRETANHSPYSQPPSPRQRAEPHPAQDDRLASPYEAEDWNAPKVAIDTRHASTRVTILMVLEPGQRGIRRHNKTADPLLCGEKGCYVGAGAASPAEFLPRRRAFGMTRTLGERAGACRNSLGCIYRGVDLVAYPAVVQPIDMRLVRHDRREPHVLGEASRCRLDSGRLACSPHVGPDYVMWVVPERIAEQAGPRELERVVEAGLRSRSAAIDVRD